MLSLPQVSIHRDPELNYPAAPPFDAGEEYPEYVFAGRGALDASNRVYGAVREALALLGLDSTRFGSPDWNPLGQLIRPGAAVLIKPNAVLDLNFNRSETVFASITHGAVLRAVIDYAYKALEGRGRIIVADAPLAHCDFANWLKLTGLAEIAALYRERLGFAIDIFDLRNLYVPWDAAHEFAPSHLRERAVRDPSGYVEVDLGAESAFAEWSEREVRLMYGSDFKRSETVKHHLGGHHRYYVARSVLEADVLISVPKLKTHQKVGVTLNIKGMVGTQGDKNYIPHHRVGPPSLGGDEYPDSGFLQNSLNRYRMWMMTGVLARETRLADAAYKVLRQLHHTGQRALTSYRFRRHGPELTYHVLGGSWHGNDTAWRMALDLIRIVLYADAAGTLHKEPQRRFLSIVDGVIGGEAEGPLSPTAKRAGVLLAGFNPLAVDAAAARLMGFDPLKVRTLAEGSRRAWLKLWEGDLSNIEVAARTESFRSMMRDGSDPLLDFRAPAGWRGRIEIGSTK
jgi:uncharacterized protein (DUF362 family)